MVLLAGGKPKVVKCDEKDGFKLTAKKLQKVISKKTKWLILNSPSNPTGAGYSKNEIEDLAKVLVKNKKILEKFILFNILFPPQFRIKIWNNNCGNSCKHHYCTSRS